MDGNRLYTAWGKDLDQSCPLPEYPRPQLKRAQWQNLNGVWAYAICDEKDASEPSEYDGDIVVPFSPESLLSGVSHQLKLGETLWYRKEVIFEEPSEDQRLHLHFGAVDQACTVFINGKKAGEHAGGYFPFWLDITSLIKSGTNTVTVRVTDDGDAGIEAYGKQKSKRGGIWYTAQSGIWQTVWAEIVPKSFIENVQITPNIDDGTVKIDLKVIGDMNALARVEIFEGDMLKTKASFTGNTGTLQLDAFKLWCPDSPFLYDIKIYVGHDCVESYFGMRKFGRMVDKNGHAQFALNDKPIFQSGLLDQGYWSDGMYTPPCDEAMIFDIQTLKDMGFNMLRKHIKIEPMRWYYHCDRLGMLVWQDFVSGGSDYNPMVIMAWPFIGVRIKDTRYARFGREDAEGRRVFERDMKRTMNLLYNCVSIAVWVPFNEGWGQFEALRMTQAIKQSDTTRLVDHASGWHDQGGGDFSSKHIYYKKFNVRRDKKKRLIALTEFGGYSCPTEGHMFSDKLFGYKMFKSKKELLEAVLSLYKREVIPAIKKGLTTAIYTQVSDVEDEINGIFTYDRKVTKFDVKEIKKLNKKLYQTFLDTIN